MSLSSARVTLPGVGMSLDERVDQPAWNGCSIRFEMPPLDSTSISFRGSTAQPSAVIDVGTTSIRMAIAEIDDAGGVRNLSALSQAVSLGKDTFTRGSLEKSTIEECVRVLKSYRRVLAESSRTCLLYPAIFSSRIINNQLKFTVLMDRSRR